MIPRTRGGLYLSTGVSTGRRGLKEIERTRRVRRRASRTVGASRRRASRIAVLFITTWSSRSSGSRASAPSCTTCRKLIFFYSTGGKTEPRTVTARFTMKGGPKGINFSVRLRALSPHWRTPLSLTDRLRTQPLNRELPQPGRCVLLCRVRHGRARTGLCRRHIHRRCRRPAR